MDKYKVGYLVGSLAKGSINRKLATALTRLAPPELVLEEIRIDELPLYNYDYDTDYPEVARRFKQAIANVDAVLFGKPVLLLRLVCPSDTSAAGPLAAPEEIADAG